MPKRIKQFLFIFSITISFYYIFVFVVKFKTNFSLKGDEKLPIIIWWTPFTGVKETTKRCNFGSCIFTEDRNFRNSANEIKAFLFYGSDFRIEDLPLPRKPWEWWALLHEESPKNQPLFDHQAVMALFNLTSTFKNNSGMPLTLQYLRSIDSLISTKEFIPTREKNKLLNTLSPIMYLQSDCNPPSERDQYVKQLIKYIPIDSYGSCLNNRKLHTDLHGIEAMNHEGILKVIANHKFTLALENAACEDYITEKLWRPLVVGSVPIYWGSPTVENWLPNKLSAINVRNYASPRDLAQYLRSLLKNDALYEKHLEHKIFKSVNNPLLRRALELRPWGINEDQIDKGTFVDFFECYVCDQIIRSHHNSIPGQVIADKDHYGCPAPETVLNKTHHTNTFWTEQWHKAKVEAEVLSKFIQTPPGTFTMDDFYEQVISTLQKEGYFEKFPPHKEL